MIKTAYDGESGSAGFLRFCEREKYIRLMAEERMIGEIVSIYLLPEYIGKGWGKALLQRAVEELHKEGYRDIFMGFGRKPECQGFLRKDGISEEGSVS